MTGEKEVSNTEHVGPLRDRAIVTGVLLFIGRVGE